VHTANLKQLRISFPHIGDYHIFFRSLVEMTGCEVVPPPTITRRTLELGSRYAPDTACVPFKYNLGNYLEALELGANAFCTAVGGCRAEYYFEVHRQILADLGHDVTFLRLSQQGLYADLRRFNPRLAYVEFVRRYWLELRKLHLLDSLADELRKRRGFELVAGAFSDFWQHFLARLSRVRTHGAMGGFARAARCELLAIPIDRPPQRLRVGIIGELFVVMEPFSNFRIEEQLARMGVEVHRWVTASSILHHGVNGARAGKQLQRMAAPYARYHVGAHGTESIARLQQMIRQGFDGAIHLKPFACMPEINAMPALRRMSQEHRFPLITLSFDSHTAEAGVLTRLEAFYDMISQKRQGGVPCGSAI